MTEAGLLAKAGVPLIFHKASEDEIPPQIPETNEIVLIHGPTGSGKSHLAAALLKRFLSSHGKHGIFAAARKMVLEIQATYSHEVSTMEIANRFLKAGFLVIDDLGVDRATADSLGWVEVIIDERWGWMRPTVITTRLSMDSIAKTYGESVASRIGSGVTWTMTGPDRRRPSR